MKAWFFNLQLKYLILEDLNVLKIYFLSVYKYHILPFFTNMAMTSNIPLVRVLYFWMPKKPLEYYLIFWYWKVSSLWVLIIKLRFFFDLVDSTSSSNVYITIIYAILNCLSWFSFIYELIWLLPLLRIFISWNIILWLLIITSFLLIIFIPHKFTV